MTANQPDFRILPESALVLAAQAGDRIAFSELVRRREGWLRGLLRRLCGDAAEVDDLAQETFLRAWRRLPGLQEPRAFGGWLRRLAVHLFIDARRLARLDIDFSASTTDVAAEDPPPDRTAGARIDLERALALLSSAERVCIALGLGEGLTHEEVAQCVSIPLGTVKSHILRGTTKLRSILGEADG